MPHRLALGLLLLLSGCVSERHFIHDSWPFGNPNAPPPQSESAYRALGTPVIVPPITPQAGDVWPGPVQPVPTIGQVQDQMNLPLGQGYTPSVPSPYPPGIDPNTGLPVAPAVPATGVPGLGAPAGPGPSGPLYSTAPGVVPEVPAVPGHIRNGAASPLVGP